jgi:membrane protein DedA with SNARE-associated domain
MKRSFKLLLGITIFLAILVLIGALLPADSFKYLAELLGSLGKFAIKTMEFLGYPGVLLLMTLESMIFPMPSELVMPFAGFLVTQGKMNFALVILFSSLGSLLGSLVSYYLGYFGGNQFVVRLGKYFLLDVTDLQKTESWFRQRGEKTILISRFIPVVRHLISIPAGIGKMNLKSFCFYTILGATLWNTFLTYCGYLLGKNWHLLRDYSEKISLALAALLLLAGIYFFVRHYRNKAQSTKALEQLKVLNHQNKS